MTSEEKGVWVFGAVSIAAYAAYVAVVLGRAAGGSLTQVPYADAMLWAIGGAVVATVVVIIVVTIVSPKGSETKDERDKQINRRGEYAGHWFVTAGAVAAIILSMLEAEHFWIANVIYLGFVLSAILATVVKLLAYRRGFSTW